MSTLHRLITIWHVGRAHSSTLHQNSKVRCGDVNHVTTQTRVMQTGSPTLTPTWQQLHVKPVISHRCMRQPFKPMIGLSLQPMASRNLFAGVCEAIQVQCRRLSQVISPFYSTAPTLTALIYSHPII